MNLSYILNKDLYRSKITHNIDICILTIIYKKH